MIEIFTTSYYFDMHYDSFIRELILMIPLFFSTIYFIGNELFKIPKKYIDFLLFIQATLVLLSCFLFFRLREFNYYYSDEHTELLSMISYALFFASIFLCEKFDTSVNLPLIFGWCYITFFLFSLCDYNTVKAKGVDVAAIINVLNYQLYFIEFSHFSPYGKIPLKTTKSLHKLLIENHKKTIKYTEYILSIGAPITFLSSITYSVLANLRIINDFSRISRLVELICYTSLSIFFAVISRRIIRVCRSNKTKKIILPYIFAVIATLLIIVINNGLRYLQWNSFWDWIDPLSIWYFIKYDIKYHLNSAWIRYPTVFLGNVITQYTLCWLKNTGNENRKECY